LPDSTTRPIATPGKNEIHQAGVDQAAAGRDHRAPGRCRRRDTGAEIAQGRLHQDDQTTDNVARISSGFTMLGRIWVSMIRIGEQPMMRACKTKSALRKLQHLARSERAVGRPAKQGNRQHRAVVTEGPRDDGQTETPIKMNEKAGRCP